MSVTREPAVRQIVLEVADDPAAAATLTEIDGTIYEARADGRCVVTGVDEGDGIGATWEPAGFVSGVVGADAAGDEDVDGVAAQRYTFDEQAIGQQDVARSAGELWVSAADGHLLKYHLDTTGNAAFFGLNADGTLTYDYSLAQVNSVADIELPDSCSSVRVDLPVMDDASDVRRSPGRLSFVIAQSLADVVAFCGTEFGALGWAPTAEPEVVGDTTVLEFASGGQALTVKLRTEDGGTKVTLLRRPPGS